MLVVISKTDLPAQLAARCSRCVRRGVRSLDQTGDGLLALRQQIVRSLTSRDDLRDAPAVSNIRHVSHLVDALETIERVEEALAAGATEELMLAELASARQSLEEITGRRAPEDLLRQIFSRFCIGK
jgi:tRNA modification GTPase